MIFNERERVSHASKLSGESVFEYLDGSARLVVGVVREKLEELILEYPEDEVSELLARFRSGNDSDFNSAYFELVLYCGLTRLGCRLEPHPVLDNGSSKRPDFLVTWPDGEQFYLEAVLASEGDGNVAGKQRMVEATLDALRRTQHDKFWVDVSYSGLPTTQPPTRKLISEIIAWLDSLDSDAVVKQMLKQGGDGPKPRVWTHEGFTLELTPRPFHSVKSNTLVRMTSGDSFISNSVKSIRHAVIMKGKKYGPLNRPLLVAVNFSTSVLDTEDEEAVLFGTQAIQFDPQDADEANPVLLRDGAWLGPKGPRLTRLSGVWIFPGLNPYSLPRCRSKVYLNPWAGRPLPKGLRKFPYAELVDDMLTHQEGITLREVFGLDLQWPLS